ncbi:class I SAM-dependent methyltransferase [Brevundimonas sp.]|uniref:class I SAM-dependent methyltransferase n=1 Tax=Brevundimonas sp. TaxID=1871086 RepID=UPI003F71D228
MLRTAVLATVCAVALSGCVIIASDTAERTIIAPATSPSVQATPESRYAAALSDSRRLPEEVARDPLRKPADMLAMMNLQPGHVIADIRPEEGYFTRLFAPVVGAGGHVYAFVPNQTAGRENAFADTLASTYSNTSRVTGQLETMTFDQPLDVVFMGEEYHDFTIPRFNVDVAAMNRRVFEVLKPGGLYVILDHQAAPGAGISVSGTLHRIEAAELRRQVEAAGFIFDGESGAVRVPSDDHTLSVFDASIRGKTDRFVYRFRKPL